MAYDVAATLMAVLAGLFLGSVSTIAAWRRRDRWHFYLMSALVAAWFVYWYLRLLLGQADSAEIGASVLRPAVAALFILFGALIWPDARNGHEE